MFKNLSNNIEEAQENIESYIKNTIDYHTLGVFKKTTLLLTDIFKFILLFSLSLSFLFFIFLGLAIYIGEQLDNTSKGFFIVAGICAIIFILIALFGKKLLARFVLSKTSKAFFNDK